MADFLQTLITSLAVGSLYALIALGYTMVYGILKFINFAHSDIVVLGAWLSYETASKVLPKLELPALTFSAGAGHPDTRLVIGLVDVTIFVTAGIFMILLQVLIYRTKLGAAMRAVSFNTDLASLMGINVDAVISFTFVLG